MLKMMQIYLKNIFFWIFVVFRYLRIFLKIYQNMGQKLDSNIVYLTIVTLTSFSF
jgi:hypothetical protein